MPAKQTLLEKLIKHPLDFSDADFDLLMKPAGNPADDPDVLTFDDLRLALKRVFNISEAALQAESDATTGPMGRFNKYMSRRRQTAYFARINGGFVGKDGHKVLVAQGDSWFQFFGRDVINWLDDYDCYAIYSMSYAGGWLANILSEEKYIEELSIHKPSAFLVSGGGNDLVGGNRLAIMTCLKPHKFIPLKRTNRQELLHANCTDEQATQIMDAQANILPDFHAFVLILKCQYYLLFSSLRKAADLQTMAIITQGYDYAIPHAGIRFDWKTPLQPLVNWILKSGQWLSQPLLIRGISNKTKQRSILMAMIFEINEMFLSLANRPEFPYLYHIDSRGNADDSDWFDELHLKPDAFRRVSDAYQCCLEWHFNHLNLSSPKVATKSSRSVFVTKDGCF